MVAKWVRRAVVLLVFVCGLLAFFGWPFPVPAGLSSAANFAVSADLWLINNAAYPGLVLLSMILAVLVAFPELSAGVMWLRQKTEPPKLSAIGPYPHLHDHEKHYRMIVANHGGEIAVNVRVLLTAITPRPRYVPWRADYPYPVNRVTAASGQEQAPCNIGANRSEAYEVIAGWEGSDGEIFAGSLDTKVDDRNPVHIEDDEHWTLSYEVVADNVASVEFALDAYVEDKALVVEVKADPAHGKKLQHRLDPRRLRRSVAAQRDL